MNGNVRITNKGRACKTCIKGKGWRYYHLKYRYRITEEDYKGLLEKQNNVCAICQRTDDEIDKRPGRPRALHVDHCHKTGKIRGLLCGKCNKAIGALGDSYLVVARAAEYLRRAE